PCTSRRTKKCRRVVAVFLTQLQWHLLLVERSRLTALDKVTTSLGARTQQYAADAFRQVPGSQPCLSARNASQRYHWL
ncbi:MAG TPA: hypothetical protein VIO57_11235, partial [Chloroflexota bacterium]